MRRKGDTRIFLMPQRKKLCSGFFRVQVFNLMHYVCLEEIGISSSNATMLGRVGIVEVCCPERCCPERRCPERRYPERRCSERRCFERRCPERRCTERRCTERRCPERRCPERCCTELACLYQHTSLQIEGKASS